MTASESMPKNNNLDVVRFTLAAMVFVSHAHDLSGRNELSFLSYLISSTFAVQAFFAISGFLIFQSYDRSRSIKSYAAKRARRILPAYLTVVSLCTVVLGLVSVLSFYDYINSAQTLKYFVFNMIFLNFVSPELPGVFQSNPIHAVNGALWTLKIEVMFYIAVPICIWLFRRFGHSPMLITLYIASAIYGFSMTWLAESRQSAAFLELGRQLPGQMTYFLAGAAIYYNFNKIGKRPIAMLVVGLALLFLSSFLLESLLRPIGVALSIMGLAFGPYIGRFGRYGDFSYGIYIVHFPILQILIFYNLPNLSLPIFLLVGVVAVLGTAVLMWHLVEKRFLRRDSHYRQETLVSFE